MRPIVAQTFTTLDGVMQAPGGAEEDEQGRFVHGGWQNAFPGADGDELVREWESRTEALLLGRRTYEIWAGAWGVWPEDAPGLEGEFTRRYNRVPKHVASRTLTELGWQNSHLLGRDLPAEVRALRDAEPQNEGGEIRVWGSSQLIRTLAEHDLVDEYRVVVYPLVLGTGKKLFGEGFPTTRLQLASTRALHDGVLVNVYRRAD